MNLQMNEAKFRTLQTSCTSGTVMPLGANGGGTRTRTGESRICNPTHPDASTSPQGASDEAHAQDSTNDSSRRYQDSELELVIETWPTLSDEIKVGILALVRARLARP